jgi:hypothetical protein
LGLPLALIGTIFGKVIDGVVTDRQQSAEIKQAGMRWIQEYGTKELQGSIDIILAEAKGEGWLQRNWRPAMMVWFAVLIGMFWFGLAPEYLVDNPQLVDKLFDIIQWGLAGYVGGRSAEKIAEIVTHKR